MHELVSRIKDPELCYVFAKNARRSGRPELALQAHRHAVELRAGKHNASSQAEAAALRAIYAYEEALSFSRGKRTRATGTWQLVNRHGVLPAVGKRLRSRDADEVQPVLVQLGMADYSFSAVEAAYPEAFTAAA
ncbi:MAG: hypothetical protein KA135_05115 [Halioglobus sp.]|nr:hypothetical protein [Halioglobus sp.]